MAVFYAVRRDAMINKLLSYDDQTPTHKEGDLFKKLEISGECFEIYYGYYEDCERENPAISPMPIYPNFLKEPKYTADGFPFVTKMQDACKHYNGKDTKYNECAECTFYTHGDDFIGICKCQKNHLQAIIN